MKLGALLVSIVLLRHQFRSYVQKDSSAQEEVNSCSNVKMELTVHPDQLSQYSVLRVALDLVMQIMEIWNPLVLLVEEACILAHKLVTESALIAHQGMCVSVILRHQLLKIKILIMVISALQVFIAQKVLMRSYLAPLVHSTNIRENQMWATATRVSRVITMIW